MSNKKTAKCLRPFAAAMLCFVAGIVLPGCHDGPLYGLKVANPYYSLYKWKQDEELGVTDHTRRKQLATLADSIRSMNDERQTFWQVHLDRILEHDDNPEMRRLAIKASGNLRTPNALKLVERGLDDDSLKVRMEACRALGTRKEPEAASLLASTVGTEADQDVRHSAIAALGNHKGEIAQNSLRLALDDRNPATQILAIESLRGVTGKNYGNDPTVWIAALEGKPTREAETRIADRVRNLF